MSLPYLTVQKDDVTDESESVHGETQISFTEFAGMARSGALTRRLFRHRGTRLLAPDLEHLTMPAATALLLKLMSRGDCAFEDLKGRVDVITWGRVAQLLCRFSRDACGRGQLLSGVQRALEELRPLEANATRIPDLARRPLYLRTDLIYGLRCGGSVGHVAGVLNNLEAFTAPPIFATPAPVPTVHPRIETLPLRPDGRFLDFPELPSLHFNAAVRAQVLQGLAGAAPAFIYQRYCRNSYAGALLARELGCPLVLEYNGSEVWIARNWGAPLPLEKLTQAIEDTVLRAADLVVVVSRAMAQELEARGIARQRVLVNPNGVNTDVYRPDMDPAPVRKSLHLEGRLVVGFIGTFGPWHGAETLARAGCLLLSRRPDLRRDLRLLFIGDGARLSAVRAIAAEGLGDCALFTGAVPQEQGPAHLAACDILVSPHVPNPDGSPFFGSPTKLFEYMGMGRPVLASRLDQIAEVLEDGATGLLVPPADPEALAAGLERLADDPVLRAHLGAAARKAAVARHTWRGHVGRIVEALHRSPA